LLEKYNEQNPDAKVEKHLQRIRGAVGGMKSILEDFLSLGKLEEGLVQTNVEEISAKRFDEEINNVVQELKVLAKKGQTFVLKNTLDRPVKADKNLLKNILINLISNAIKFSGDDSVITVEAALGEKELAISVKDEGIGISDEDRQHLFGRFFRAKNASNIQGTGLGLHIVGKYLELMNGWIELKSAIHEGSTFTIYIPQTFNDAKSA
jgi:signal transduction histidine kinase